MEHVEYRQFQTWATELDKVFTIQDLRVAFNKTSTATIYRIIQSLEESEDLFKIKRGYYATKNADLSAVSSRIYPSSYVSTGTILAKSKVIGSIPARKIQAVKIGTPSHFTCALGTIEYLSISPKLFFGFQRTENINWATAEKAYLDCCYFFYKRRTFSFDLDSDVDRSLLNSKRIEQYLNSYDKRFVTYFREKFWKR